MPYTMTPADAVECVMAFQLGIVYGSITIPKGRRMKSRLFKQFLICSLLATPVSANAVGDGGVSAFYGWTTGVTAKPGQPLR